jgi:hypothetical protein
MVAPYLKYCYFPRIFFHFHCIFSRGTIFVSLTKSSFSLKNVLKNIG